MQKLIMAFFVATLVACPQKTKQIKTVIANPSSNPATQPQDDEEIGLLSVQIAPLSEQVACVYGGWTCLSGEQFSLLRCTTDGGATFTDAAPAAECSYIKDYQVSRDGNSIWFSCEAKTGAPHIIRSTDKAQTFAISEPITPRGEMLAWAFSSSKNGLAVIAAEGELAERDVAYIEKSTTDAGATWKTLLEIKGEFAAQFNPDQEIGRRPPQPAVSSLLLQQGAGPDGGPAYQVKNTAGKQMLSLAWRDIPGKCSPAASLPTEELFPGFGPMSPQVK